MALSRIKDSGTTPIPDGTTYDPAESGSDQGVMAAMFLRDSVLGSTITDFQLNSVNFVQDIAVLDESLTGASKSYMCSGTISESAIPASGTFDCVLSTAATGEGGLVITVAGMKQTGTIVTDMQLQTFASTSMPSLTFNINAGQMLVMMYESNSSTLTAPTTASSGDSYVERANGALTGSPLTQGKIYTLIATSDMTSESEGNWLSGSPTGAVGLAIFDFEPAAGGLSIPIASYHYNQRLK